VAKPSGLRERTKRDFTTAQTDTFAGAKVEEKASVCLGRNDKICGDARGWTTRYEDRGAKEYSFGLFLLDMKDGGEGRGDGGNSAP
jgi:hypothetical protein